MSGNSPVKHDAGFWKLGTHTCNILVMEIFSGTRPFGKDYVYITCKLRSFPIYFSYLQCTAFKVDTSKFLNYILCIRLTLHFSVKGAKKSDNMYLKDALYH